MSITSIKTESFNSLLSKISPIKNLLIFTATFLGTHFIWKLIVNGDRNSNQIDILGIDCSSFFHSISVLTAKCAYNIMHFMGMHNTLINDTYLFYQTPNGGFVNIIWGCTGVKQFLMFFIIMLVTPGSFKKKFWFTPLALFLLWAYNITRIIVITYKTGIDPSCFEYLHVIFNNVFYVFMFIIWLVWEELVNKKKIQGVTY